MLISSVWIVLLQSITEKEHGLAGSLHSKCWDASPVLGWDPSLGIIAIEYSLSGAFQLGFLATNAFPPSSYGPASLSVIFSNASVWVVRIRVHSCKAAAESILLSLAALAGGSCCEMSVLAMFQGFSPDIHILL